MCVALCQALLLLLLHLLQRKRTREKVHQPLGQQRLLRAGVGDDELVGTRVGEGEGERCNCRQISTVFLFLCFLFLSFPSSPLLTTSCCPPPPSLLNVLYLLLFVVWRKFIFSLKNVMRVHMHLTKKTPICVQREQKDRKKVRKGKKNGGDEKKQ